MTISAHPSDSQNEKHKKKVGKKCKRDRNFESSRKNESENETQSSNIEMYSEQGLKFN